METTKPAEKERKEKMEELLSSYRSHLENQEKSANTVEKYVRDVRNFLIYTGMETPPKELVLKYKSSLKERYRISSANSMLMAVNSYLKYRGQRECCVSAFRQEYQRLVQEARKRGMVRIEYILLTLGMTGIRVGELAFITVESLKEKMVRIQFKNKERVILLPKTLRKLLEQYCRNQKIKEGSIFVTRTGKAMDRRNIWAQMKKLCQGAGVLASKVFPHNLRHLFARCYYEKEKDLVRLADHLGHSSLETTRRYTITSDMEDCMKRLELGLEVAEGRGKDKKVSKTLFYRLNKGGRLVS